MASAFFTLPPDYSVQLHSQIWELCQFGNGFIWSDVYKMPVHWRRFYYQKLADLKKKERDEYKKVESKQKAASSRVRFKR